MGEIIMEQKLPKEFKEKWIAALRSGEYKQGRCQLEREGKYCCLGVACVIADKNINIMNYQYIPEDNKEVPYLLKGRDGDNIIVAILTNMNDQEMRSFTEIADWIEENL